jgi:hypothetical protein
MGWSHVNQLPGFRVDPPPEDAPARKDKSMRTVLAQDGKLQVAIEWCSRYGLPIHHKIIGHTAVRALDLDH